MNDNTDNTISASPAVVFKRKRRKGTNAMKNKRLRRRTVKEEDDNDDVKGGEVVDMKLLQRMRERPKGLAISDNAMENADNIEQQEDATIAARRKKEQRILGMTAAFRQEHNDTKPQQSQMQQYIEEELAKRQGKASAAVVSSGVDTAVAADDEEDALYRTPAHLKVKPLARDTTAGGERWLTGIAEVALGTEAKLKNIQDTEQLKLQMFSDNTVAAVGGGGNVNTKPTDVRRMRKFMSKQRRR